MAKRLKDSGVSPVIATILMVAITVVLAAVLYVMVSGFTHAPPASQSVGLTGATQSGNYWNMSISSVSASNIAFSNIRIVITGATGSATPLNAAFTYGSVSSSGSSVSYTATSYASNVTIGILSGNSGKYLATGDTLSINSGSTSWATGLTGATVTIYNGNSELGSTTL